MWFLLASLLLVVSGYVQASPSVSDQTLTKESRKELQELLLRGQAFEELGQFEAAISTFQAVIEQDEFSANAWRGLCWAKIQSGHWVEARPACSRSFEFDVGDHVSEVSLATSSAARLGHTYLLAGDEEDAARWYREALVLIPNDEALKSPMADFELFINKDWQADASTRWKSWFAQVHPRWVSILNNLSEEVKKPASPIVLRETSRIKKEALELLGSEPWFLRSQSVAATAQMLSQTGDGQRAIEVLELKVVQETENFGPEHIVTSVALNYLAESLRMSGRHSDAEPIYSQALAIQETKIGQKHPFFGLTLNNLALLHHAKGQYSEAEPLFQRSIAVLDAAFGGDGASLALNLSNLGYLYRTTGRHAEAITLYNRSLKIYEKHRGAEHPDTARTLNNIAQLYRVMGMYAAAEPLLRRAAHINEQSLGRHHPATAIAQSNLAGLLSDTGRFADAEPLFQAALENIEKAFGPNHSNVAISMLNLASLYHAMGQYSKSEQLILRAKAIAEKNLGAMHPVIANYANNLAMLMKDTGRYIEAESLNEHALEIREMALGKDHPDVALSLNNLAGGYIETGRYAEAEELFARALAIRDSALGPEHPSTAMSRYNLASVYQKLNRFSDAQPLARSATASLIFRGQEPADLASVQSNYGRLQDRLSKPDVGIYWQKRAVNEFQALRKQIGKMAPASQLGFLKRNEEYYHALANNLVNAGRFAEAQQVLTMLKEQELFELTELAVADPRSTRVIYTGLEQRFNAELDALLAPVIRIREERDELANKARNFPLDAIETARKAELDAIVEQVRERLNAFFDQVDARFAQLDEADRAQIRELNAQAVQPLQATLAKHRAQSGKSSVLLNYLVLGEEVQILVTTPTTQQRYAVAVKREELNQRIQSLRQAIQRRGPVETDAHQLYQWLIEPVSADLQAADAQVLMLALNDTLRYLPFAALHDGERWLIERYRLSVLTDAGQADLTSPPQPNWTVEAFGSSQAHGEFSALPHVVGELAGIERVRGQRTETWLDLEFTEARLTQAVSQQPPVLHIASHFAFRPGSERESQLLLGDGSLMSLQRLREYKFADLDLLVLSACETAMGGGREETGREVEGFAALAQRRGANAVLATLWKVADVSTAQLMERFYAIRAGAGTTKAEALRQAQLSLLNGEGLDEAIAATQAEAQGQRVALRGQRSATLLDALDDTPVSDPKRPYAHPFYWAPFVLMGNWL